MIAYLDWAATTPPDLEILRPAFEASSALFANPSSAHRAGKEAKQLLDDSRSSMLLSLAPSFGGSLPPGGLVFTASGTEADQIPLLALLRNPMKGSPSSSMGRIRPHLLISAIEHAAIDSQAEALGRLGFDCSFVKPDSHGFIQPDRIAEALRSTTKIVAVMAVNNETGAIQDIGAIGRSIASGAASLGIPSPLFHVDCVQALGKIHLDLSNGTPTSAAFSAHKIQGPKGVGALWHTKPIEPIAVGGGQEGGLRSGTENIFGISAFAACAAKAVSSLNARLEQARIIEESILMGLKSIPGACAVPLGREARDPRYSPWIVSAAFPGLGGEVFARALSDAGIAVSTGSACSHTHARKGRRILDAMGLPEELSFSTIRVSFGPATRLEEIDFFLSTAEDLYRRLKT